MNPLIIIFLITSIYYAILSFQNSNIFYGIASILWFMVAFYYEVREEKQGSHC